MVLETLKTTAYESEYFELNGLKWSETSLFEANLIFLFWIDSVINQRFLKIKSQTPCPNRSPRFSNFVIGR